jgi:PAS domain S-box-containing protein
MSNLPTPRDSIIFEQLIENIFDACWTIDVRDGGYKVEYVNHAASEILGYSSEVLYAQPEIWFKIIHPDDHQKYLDSNLECLQTGSSEVRYRIFPSSGKMKWIHSKRKLIRDEHGKPSRMLGITTDITEAVLNENKRGESEKLFQSLATYAPIGIYKTDKGGLCTYVNPKWVQLSGITAEEALGFGWVRSIHPTDAHRVTKEWIDATSHNKDFLSEFRFINPTTGERTVHSQASPIVNSQGEVTGFVGTTEDITERKVTEATLNIQRQKLVASAKMSSLGEMASGIAHEINNPLMIITGICSRVRRSLEGVQNPECVKDISKIESTAFRISKIIKGLKSFSRNAEDDVKELVTLNRIIEDTFELCGQRFENENIRIKKDLNGLEELVVKVRPTQIVQVLLNLLSNSYDAVEKLDQRWIEISLEKTLHGAVIKVTDSGPGIPEELVEKMMEPFFTTKEVGKGTGIGLSISRGIMEYNDGKLIYVRSSHTCFALEFFTASF